jgi:hypothetical protein
VKPKGVVGEPVMGLLKVWLSLPVWCFRPRERPGRCLELDDVSGPGPVVGPTAESVRATTIVTLPTTP